MNKKLIGAGAVLGILSFVLVFPKSSMAAWPFDSWFKNSQVKGEQTEARKTVSISNFFRTLKATPTPSVTSQPEEEIEKTLSEEKLTKAVKTRLITEAQKKEMSAKLAEIKAKRLEVKKLQDAFVVWMKENHLDTKDLTGAPKKISPTTSTSTPSVKR